MDDAQSNVQQLFQRWRQSPRADPVDLCKDCPELLPALQACITRALNPAAENTLTLQTDSPPSDSPTAPANPLENHAKLPIIEGYTILKKVAEGGQGAVYQAMQASPQRKVAIKVLLESPYSSKSAKHRFEREIDLVATLRHPHIVAVFASGKTADGHLYYVMDYVRGVPLTAYVRNNKLPLEKTLELFSIICEAVNHAHQKGVMHRDLKPGNILVDAEGNPRILDFGMAKQMAEPAQSLGSMTGQVMGTLPYMSPEQARGNPDSVDVRTDVYALGVILYELLTGVFPYPVMGAMVDVLQHIERTQPAPLARSWSQKEGVTTSTRRRLRGGCPIDNEVETIALKALSKERNRRYQSAGELGRDVAHYLRGEVIEAKRDSGIYLLKRAFARYRALAATGLVFVLFLIASTLVFWALRGEAARQRDAASANAARALTAEQIAASSEHQAVLNLADAYAARGLDSGAAGINGLPGLWFAEATITARADAQRTQTNMIGLENWLSSQWEPVAAIVDPDSDQLAFDPLDARYVITGKRRGAANGLSHVWNMATEKEIKAPAGFEESRAAEWTARGQVLLGSTQGHVGLFSVPGMEVLGRWEVGDAVSQVATSADGTWMAAAAGKKILIWTLGSDAKPAVVGQAAAIVSAAFSPNGQLLLTCGDDDRARVYSVVPGADSATPRVELAFPAVIHMYRSGYWTHPPLLLEGGRTLLTIDGFADEDHPGYLKWYDAASGKELDKTRISQSAVWNLVAAPDGMTLAVMEGGSLLYDVATRRAIGSVGDRFSGAFHPKQPIFAMGKQHVLTIDIKGKKAGPRVFLDLNTPGGAATLAFSADGLYLGIQERGLVQIWRMPELTPEGPTDHWLSMDGSGSWATLTADGRFVAPIGMMDGNANVRSIQVHEVEGGKPVGQRLPLGGALLSAAFSPDGTLIAAATGFKDDKKQLRLWDWKQGSEACPAFSLPAEPVTVAYAPDGKAVAVHCIDGQVFLIDPADGHQLLHFRCSATRDTEGGAYPWISGLGGSLRFSRDGKSIYTLGSPVVQAWDRSTGLPRFTIKHDGNCWALAESPDGRMLATGGHDFYLHLSDAATGAGILPGILHPREISEVAFSPDGQELCTSCVDNQVRIWNVRTGALRLVLSPGGTLIHFAYTPDGRWIVTASRGIVQIWDVRSGFAVTPGSGPSNNHEHIEISRDGHWAVVAGMADKISIIDLRQTLSPGSRTAEQARQWAELLSCSRIDGSTVVSLTSTEWLDRWRRYRSEHQEVGMGAVQSPPK